LLKIVFVGTNHTEVERLCATLTERGMSCLQAPEQGFTPEWVSEQQADLALVAVGDSRDADPVLQQLKEAGIPVIVLLASGTLGELDPALPVDDFVVEPWRGDEVATRVQRLLSRFRHAGNDKIIRRGDLVIAEDKCEVWVAGKNVALTYKEYELLRFLARNDGNVITRELLLERVWRYQYFGGERTVDVHIRRLRSKIEDSTHSFIETVRNVGYRFRAERR